MKRDDQTGLALGGNKTRKLEYLVPDALASGADTLVSIGGVQSNHTRQVAAVAATPRHQIPRVGQRTRYSCAIDPRDTPNHPGATTK